MYALANDENGTPLDVPATAAGWLVRRHAGGKGRPGAVYDADGRPLVAPLGATARDLRTLGCGAGSYRLEAVDANRRAVGVVAFTELKPDEDDPIESRADEHRGAEYVAAKAIEALARSVEAMQRTQAERERAHADRERALTDRDRVQTELFGKLMQRFAPAAPQAPVKLKEILGEHVDVQRAIRKLSGASEAPAASAVVVESAPAPEFENVPGWQRAVDAFLPLAMPFLPLVLDRVGMSQEQIKYAMAAATAAMQANAGVPINAPDPTADVPAAPPPPAPAPVAAATADGDPALGKQIRSIFALLTAEERATVQAHIDAISEADREALKTRVMSVTPEQAVAFLRATVLRPAANTNAAKADGDTDRKERAA